jgi:alpha-tubulin suppressor-like RCC1 family protein
VEVEYCERKEAEVENVALVSGGNHSCVLQRDNGIRCWGMNAAGQLGLGHTENIGDDEPIYSAEPIFFENKITNLAAGGFHTCALDEIGDVYCWGGNDYGQLGYGDTVNRGVTELATSLSPVSLGQKAKKIYAGTFLTCAILENDTARCWGLNRSGQLGLGHVEPIGDNELPTDVPALTFSKEISQFDLSTVSNHVCALFVDGAQKCWGDNLRGQLGLGDKDNRGDNELLSDVPFISVDNNADPIFVATGNEHTCVLLDNQNIDLIFCQLSFLVLLLNLD